jgi:hypothetical protein
MEALRKKERGGGQNRMKLSLSQKVVLEFHPLMNANVLLCRLWAFGSEHVQLCLTRPLFLLSASPWALAHTFYLLTLTSI